MPRPRRISRILLNAATAVSLVLCIATAVLWVRSYRLGDVFGWGGAGGTVWISSSRGSFCFDCERLARPNRYLYPRGWYYETADLRDYYNTWGGFSTTFKFAGLRAARRHDSTSGGVYGWDYYRLVVPMWAAVIAWTILPALSVGRFVRGRHRRAAAGACCPACGYDLRATPDRCPECGMIPAR